jgi:hypothetical protein
LCAPNSTYTLFPRYLYPADSLRTQELDIMGLLAKFTPKMGAVAQNRADVEAAQAAAPHLARVDWRSDPGLRKLYFWCFFICIASATTGYDG